MSYIYSRAIQIFDVPPTHVQDVRGLLRKQIPYETLYVLYVREMETQQFSVVSYVSVMRHLRVRKFYRIYVQDLEKPSIYTRKPLTYLRSIKTLEVIRKPHRMYNVVTYVVIGDSLKPSEIWGFLGGLTTLWGFGILEVAFFEVLS